MDSVELTTLISKLSLRNGGVSYYNQAISTPAVHFFKTGSYLYFYPNAVEIWHQDNVFMLGYGDGYEDLEVSLKELKIV